MPAMKKPKIRRAVNPPERAVNPPEPEEIPVRVLDAPVEDIDVRVVDALSDDVTTDLSSDVSGDVDAPPLPEDHPAADRFASAELAMIGADSDKQQEEEIAQWNLVPYLTSAITHASLVLLLGLLTFGGDAVHQVVTLGVIEESSAFDEEPIAEDTFEMRLEPASSSPDTTDLVDHPEVRDVTTYEPPSLDTSTNNDSPKHLEPGDDRWAPLPAGIGPRGKDGGNGSQGTKNGSASGSGKGGRDGAPSYAVRKGSFAAWTVPKDPRPLRPYKIIIQVTLPKDIKVYSKDDLRGYVSGTDGYGQKIPQREAKVPTRRELEEMIDSGNIRLGNGGASGDRMARRGRAPAAERTQLKQLLRAGRLKMSKPAGGTFSYRSGRARISITVPGAKNRVQDRIEIKSKILDEEQVLEIEF